MANLALCQQFLASIRQHPRAVDTHLRLAAVIRQSCQKDPELQQQLELSDAELSRLPQFPK